MTVRMRRRRGPGRTSATPRTGRSTSIDTGIDVMTGGRVQRLEPMLDGRARSCSPTATASPTSNLTQLLEFHRKHGTLATVTAVRPPARFGGLVLRRRALVEGLHREAADRRGLDQRRLHGVRARGASSTSRTTRRSSRPTSLERARRETASSRPTGTTASGSAWTRCAT